MTSTPAEQIAHVLELDGEVVIGTKLVENGQHDFIRVCDVQSIIREQQEVIKQLVGACRSVLCDPEGTCVFEGSDGDRAFMQQALALAKPFVDTKPQKQEK